MPDIFKNTGADILGSITRSIGAPIALLEGNTRQAGTDAGGAFANAIEASDDLPVVGKYAGPAVAGFFGGPLGYGAAKGIQTGVEAARHGASYGDAALGGLESGALGGATAYAGSQLGGALGDALGSNTASTTGTAAGSNSALGGSSSGSMVGTPSALGTTSIASDSGGGSLASGTGIGGNSGSVLSTGSDADSQFMNGNYGSSLATNTGSNAVTAAAPQSTSIANSIGNFLQKPTSGVIQNALSNSSALNGVGDYFGTSGLGAQLGNSIGNGFSGQTMGNTLGGLAGADVGGNISQGIYNKMLPGSSTSSPAPVLPGMMAGMALPGDLSSLNGLDQNQQLSNIATRGVYGGGVGTQDDQYYLNQLNNSLVNSPGNYQPTSSISPINNSFLSQLGLGGYGNTQDLLTAIQGWQPPTT